MKRYDWPLLKQSYTKNQGSATSLKLGRLCDVVPFVSYNYYSSKDARFVELLSHSQHVPSLGCAQTAIRKCTHCILLHSASLSFIKFCLTTADATFIITVRHSPQLAVNNRQPTCTQMQTSARADFNGWRKLRVQLFIEEAFFLHTTRMSFWIRSGVPHVGMQSQSYSSVRHLTSALSKTVAGERILVEFYSISQTTLITKLILLTSLKVAQYLRDRASVLLQGRHNISLCMWTSNFLNTVMSAQLIRVSVAPPYISLITCLLLWCLSVSNRSGETLT